MRIGQRCNMNCAAIVTVSGDSLPWVNEIRYLGVYISKFKHFKCSLDYSKWSFYRAAIMPSLEKLVALLQSR